MIDFSTLKGLTIPEGNVKQISDASGRVLWSAKPSEATVTITGDWSDTTITINGVTYYDTTVVVPIGTVITCYANNDENRTPYGIYLNGVHVALTTYAYTITCNVHIETRGGRDGGYVYITEIREDYALVNITGNASATDAYSVARVSADVDGTGQKMLGVGTYAVPIGTIFVCSVTTQKNAQKNGGITANGVRVVDGTGTYEYTASVNTTIYTSGTYTTTQTGAGNITITEQ